MLKKHAFIITNSIIILFIVAAFIVTQVNEYYYYKDVTIEQARTDINFTAVDISATLTNIITEQLVASQMMANDIFLKMWAESETIVDSDDQRSILYEYLNEYKEKYGYDVVFFVSDSTYKYYYNGGLNKVVSPEDEFDCWYFNFLNLKQEYDIQIDRDEVNNFSVSLFVNCLVTGRNGETLGVVGVGNKIDDFQKTLSNYKDSMGLKICIVNKGNAHNSFTGSTDYYKTVDDASKYLNLNKNIVTMNVGDEGYTWNEGNICTDIRYNKALNWNIIVQEDITDRINEFAVRINHRIAFLIGTIIIYAIVSFTLLSRLNRLTYKSQNTDELTGLMNNRLFKEKFAKENKRKLLKTEASLFMLDVDNFKSFNDTLGHLYGNAVLHIVTEVLRESIGTEGYVARWGGDEFIGVIYNNPDKAQEILDKAQEIIAGKDTQMPISFSCGICKITGGQKLEKNIEIADTALYKSKEDGKGRCTIYNDTLG